MKKLMIIFLFFLKITLAQVKDSIVLSNKVSFLRDQIANVDEYMGENIGYDGKTPEQWKNYKRLIRKANNDELIELTKSKSAVVRCYAFQGLAERHYENTFDILLDHLNDDEYVETYIGCLGGITTVGDFYIDVVTTETISYESYQLNQKEKHKIDSILIFDSTITLSSKSSLLYNMSPNSIYYQRIKEIYINEELPEALVALSKYKNKEDLNYINDWLNKENISDLFYGMKAAVNYPDKTFLPIITKIQESELLKQKGFNYGLIRLLYYAIAQYQNLESKELILKALDTKNEVALKYHTMYIWLALTKYPHPIYNSIKEKLTIPEWRKKELEFWIENPER